MHHVLVRLGLLAFKEIYEREEDGQVHSIHLLEQADGNPSILNGCFSTCNLTYNIVT